MPVTRCSAFWCRAGCRSECRAVSRHRDGRHGYIPKRVTEELAETISELYFTCEKDRTRMGHELGIGRSLDDLYLHHPLVRRRIVEKVRQMRRDKVYTREQHIASLQRIRDGAMGDENWKVALASEIAVGTAAGLYEKIDPDGESGGAGALPPPENLTTEQIRERLARLQQPALPSPEEGAF